MKKKSSQQLHMLRYTLTEQLIHGMEVSNLAYDLARELGYEKEICYELAKAGVLHDIGKVVLENYVEEQDTLVVEEMRFVRTHPTLGYELLQGRGYSDFVLESILYHHGAYDRRSQKFRSENVPGISESDPQRQPESNRAF